jgi:amino acid permease
MEKMGRGYDEKKLSDVEDGTPRGSGSDDIVVGEQGVLSRSLKSRHMQMIAIGTFDTVTLQLTVR